MTEQAWNLIHEDNNRAALRRVAESAERAARATERAVDVCDIEWIGRGGTRGDVILNGVDISRYVKAFTYETVAGQSCRVVIELVNRALLHIKEPTAAVEIGDGTPELLKSLGWTPPADEQ